MRQYILNYLGVRSTIYMQEAPNKQFAEIEFSNHQLDETTLPRVAYIEYSPLEKNLLKANLIWTTLFFTIGIAIVLFLQYVIKLDGLVNYGNWVLLGLMALFILSATITYFGFFKKSYAIREKDIIFNTGLFWRSSTAIPFNRVQHCEVSIGPIDRMFDLSELKVFTAGGSNSDLKIEGLRPDTANRLKDYIVNKTGIDEEE
ncbi:MAG: PH domain-containing protein [Saprospiraceae bacterium]|nr:PH domain-containing protein [Saprospiraceae bacterium]